MSDNITDRLFDATDRDAVADAVEEINNLRNEVARLQDIVTRMGRIYKHLNPENHPGVYFIHGSLGSYDQNGMPEQLMVVPAYGVDFSYIYQRTDKTTGPEW
jgi:hypothetical protein